MPAKSSLITYSTSLSVTDVIDRTEKILKEKNVSIFARINHSDGARKVGLIMQDEELIIFGNPQIGTPLMIESPAIGIELPLKIIAWKDNEKTIVGFQNPDDLISDYKILKSTSSVEFMKKFLINLVEAIIK